MRLIRNENRIKRYFRILESFLLMLLLFGFSYANSITEILNIKNETQVKNLLSGVDLINSGTEVKGNCMNLDINYLSALDIYFPVFGANINLLENYSINMGFGFRDYYGNTLEYYLFSANFKKEIRESSKYDILISVNKRITNNKYFKNRVLGLRVLVDRNFSFLTIGGGAEFGIENGRFSNENISLNLADDSDYKLDSIIYCKVGFLHFIGKYSHGNYGVGVDVGINL
ncbi:MAG: hypothetical protein U9N76_02905 [Candidatus Marinimicrobia bacterium]|nr:hypothetical protein [Candidatus Neomarinimicrobiota bacterium]